MLRETFDERAKSSWDSSRQRRFSFKSLPNCSVSDRMKPSPPEQEREIGRSRPQDDSIDKDTLYVKPSQLSSRIHPIVAQLVYGNQPHEKAVQVTYRRVGAS